jgi:hypothetical protein
VRIAAREPAVARQCKPRRAACGKLSAEMSKPCLVVVHRCKQGLTAIGRAPPTAVRAPSSVSRSDTETATLKVAAYEDIWKAAVRCRKVFGRARNRHIDPGRE